MKIEKLRAKLAKYEAAYREAREQLRDALHEEIAVMDEALGSGRKSERRVHKSKGGKRGPKAMSTKTGVRIARSAKIGATAQAGSKRRPGRPKMTEAQKAAAREMRRQKLATVSNEGAMVAMDEAVYMAQPVHE